MKTKDTTDHWLSLCFKVSVSSDSFFSNYIQILSLWQKRRRKLLTKQTEEADVWVWALFLKRWDKVKHFKNIFNLFSLLLVCLSHHFFWVMSSSFPWECLCLHSSIQPTPGKEQDDFKKTFITS